MKCIKSNQGIITRVQDAQAEVKVKTGLWSYVPKSEWKKINVIENVRNTYPANVEGSTEFNQANKVVKNKKPPKQTKQDKKKR